jgi:uncharacterized protein
MSNTKSWDELRTKFNTIAFNESFDIIVAIANGGIVPSAIINQRLHLPIELLKINFRDNRQQPLYQSPKLLTDINYDVKGKRVLLIEDRVKTGATLQFAKELMKDAALVKTFAVNGKADYALYDEACFNFPWIV